MAKVTVGTSNFKRVLVLWTRPCDGTTGLREPRGLGLWEEVMPLSCDLNLRDPQFPNLQNGHREPPPPSCRPAAHTWMVRVRGLASCRSLSPGLRTNVLLITSGSSLCDCVHASHALRSGLPTRVPESEPSGKCIQANKQILRRAPPPIPRRRCSRTAPWNLHFYRPWQRHGSSQEML